MPDFYTIIARKKYFPKFWGHVPPVYYTYAYGYSHQLT